MKGASGAVVNYFYNNNNHLVYLKMHMDFQARVTINAIFKSTSILNSILVLAKLSVQTVKKSGLFVYSNAFINPCINTAQQANIRERADRSYTATRDQDRILRRCDRSVQRRLLDRLPGHMSLAGLDKLS